MSPEPEGGRTRLDILEIFGGLLVFFVLGSEAAPDVNEPHYWTLAERFWDPSFCVGDLLLDRPPAHWLYMATVGSLTRCASLPVAAWTGRVIGWLMLSLGWCGLLNALGARRGVAVLSAAAWIMLTQAFQMSGEWVIGGCEAKVIAYAFVLWAWRTAIQGRYGTCWMWLGFASAFHVLVGGWAVVMTAVGLLAVPPLERGTGWQHLRGLAIGGILSLMGLVPALRLSNGSPEIVQAAQSLYVMERLVHHLMIRDFPPLFVLRHIALAAIFAALWWPVRLHPLGRRVWGMVWTALLLSAIGALLDSFVGGTPLGNSLMRFYWFRASDIFLPLGVVCATMLNLMQAAHFEKSRILSQRIVIAIVLSVCLYSTGYTYQLWTYTIPAADWQGGIRRTTEWYDWKDLCQWIRESTPANAIFLTPSGRQTFKWYAGRAEVVTWKDVPQDAIGLLEWKKRLDDVQAWQSSTTTAEYRARWLRLRSDYSFQYVVIRSRLPVRLPNMHILYRNTKYQVGIIRQ